MKTLTKLIASLLTVTALTSVSTPSFATIFDWAKTTEQKECTKAVLIRSSINHPSENDHKNVVALCTRAISTTSDPLSLSHLYWYRAQSYERMHGCMPEMDKKGPSVSECEFSKALSDYYKSIEYGLKVDKTVVRSNDSLSGEFMESFARMLTGQIEFKMGDYDAAVRSFTRFSTGEKYIRENTYWIARSYYAKGDLAKAKDLFTTIVNKDDGEAGSAEFATKSKEYLAKIDKTTRK
jgi:tetratricopeptide (TPR) repeat protein